MSSRLALGTVQFGLAYGIANLSGKVSRVDAAVILAAASASGMDTLDTAIAYGDSENCLGEVGVAGWRIVTKLPTLREDCPDVAGWVAAHLDASLRRLGVDQLHGLLLHNPRQLLGAQGAALASALRAARASGRVERIGVSIYAPDDLAAIYPMLSPDLVQAPLNLIDRRLVDSGWLQRLNDNGVEVHTRSSFLQGLLLMPQVPTRFAPWEALWTRWQQWLAAHPGQAAAACLAYPLSFPQVTRVVVGVDNLAHFVELLDAERMLPMAGELPDLRSDNEELINPSNWVSS